MRAVIVYESMFGNTETIARAVADGLSSAAQVDLLEVSEGPHVIGDGVDVLVVGGPTHAFGMSRERTRADASQRSAGDIVSKQGGIREWLESLSVTSPELAGATFDTKVRKPRLPGSAAHSAGRQLRHLGIRPPVSTETFYLTDMKGPLAEGEVERARSWGEDLARKIQRRKVA